MASIECELKKLRRLEWTVYESAENDDGMISLKEAKVFHIKSNIRSNNPFYFFEYFVSDALDVWLHDVFPYPASERWPHDPFAEAGVKVIVKVSLDEIGIIEHP